MRDPERIDRICKLLAEKWKKQPNQRLGQFLINYIFHVPTKSDISMYMQKDNTTELRLVEWEKRIKRIAKSQKQVTDFGGTSGK